MKKSIGLLLIGVGITALINARYVEKKAQDTACFPQELTDEIAQEQEACDRVKDDPYEDLICERSQLKIRRRVKELEACKNQEIEKQQFDTVND